MENIQQLINAREARIETLKKEILALMTVIPILAEQSDTIPTDVHI